MRHQVLILVICAGLLSAGCTSFRRAGIQRRQREFSPAVALVVFQHCTSQMEAGVGRMEPGDLHGRFELTIEFQQEKAILRDFLVSVDDPETETALSRCARFAQDYFDSVFSDVRTKWTKPVTVRGAFFPFESVEAVGEDGKAREMTVAIEMLGKSGSGSSLYRLRYYEPRPTRGPDPDAERSLEIRIDTLRGSSSGEDDDR